MEERQLQEKQLLPCSGFCPFLLWPVGQVLLQKILYYEKMKNDANNKILLTVIIIALSYGLS